MRVGGTKRQSYLINDHNMSSGDGDSDITARCLLRFCTERSRGSVMMSFSVHLNMKYGERRCMGPISWTNINTLGPRQNGRHFANDIFKWIFLNENVWISIKISMKFVPGGPNNNFPALVRIMAWRRPGDKPLSEPMIVYWRTYTSLGLNELSINHVSKTYWPTTTQKTQ